jgi:predicted KAP-like P-loop ATPase
MAWRRRHSEQLPPTTDPIRTTLDADAPVASEEEDALGRAPFAARLARQVELAPTAGMVIALIGPWGSGKTSVLRMVEQRLLRADVKPPPVVLWFNPWLVSGSEQLVSQFFKELAAALPQQLGPERGTRAAERLRNYAAGVRTLERAPGVGWAFQLGGAVMDEFGERIDRAPISLQAERERARESLAELSARIVVLIDDVDRLMDTEIRDLMRMIKLVGDFPRVTYLLAFDRHPVEHALAVGGISGADYLEKIVQIEYRLPEPPAEKLQQLLIKRINLAIADVPPGRLDGQRWPAMFDRIIEPLISRPRHIKRFTNALPLALEVSGEDVDVADVLALTALQTLLPRFYDQLPALREDLTPRLSRLALWQRDTGKTESAGRLNSAAEASGRPDVARSVYELLFPESLAALENHYFPDEPMTWQRKRRVADREAFDTYLTATLPEGALATAEVREALSSFDDPALLASVLAAHDPAKLPALVQRLRAHLDEIPLERIEAAIPILETQTERLTALDEGIFSPSRRIRGFTLKLISRFPNIEEREGVVRRLLASTEQLTARLIWTRDLGQEDERGEPVLPPDVRTRLQQELAGAIVASSIDDLLREEKPGWLLRMAEDEGGDEQAARVRTLLSDGRLLPSYLTAFMKFGAGAPEYVLQIDELETRQGKDRLLAMLGGVTITGLSDLEREALRQLVQHYAGGERDT